MPERPDIADWPSPRRTRPRRTCFLSSQMNAIRGFSAPLNGVQPGHLAKMSSRQKQETPRTGLSGTHYMTDVENQFWQAVECAGGSRLSHCSPALLGPCGLHSRLETLYRYAGRFGSPHHIGCAVAAGERNNKVRLRQHLLVSDRSCRAPVGFPISMADVPLNLRLGRCPFHCELIGSRRSTLHQFRYGLLLVQPVERTKDLRRASEIPSSANQDLHDYRQANGQIVWMLKGKMEFRLGTEQRVCSPAKTWSIREIRRSTRLGATMTPR